MKNKLTAKLLVIASDWFESLSEKKQKEYIAQHPDSKFAHKVGTGRVNPKVTKSKQSQMEHLEGEGVNLDKDYFGQGRDKQSLIHTVADNSGKKGSSSGKAPARTLLDDVQSHKSKLRDLKTKLLDLKLKQKDLDSSSTKYQTIQDRIESIRDKISDLINK